MTTLITLVRHGQTSWNSTGRWQGHAPVPLNDEGRQQAAYLAAYLSTYPFPIGDRFTAIITSDLSRAAETATIADAVLHLGVTRDSRLREIDLGDWQGLTYEDVSTWDNERYHAVQVDPYMIRRPGGESWQDVSQRASEVLHELTHVQRNGHSLVFTHGGTIRSVVRHLGLLHEAIQQESVHNCSLTTLHYHYLEQRWELFRYNDHAYLQRNSYTRDEGNAFPKGFS